MAVGRLHSTCVLTFFFFAALKHILPRKAPFFPTAHFQMTRILLLFGIDEAEHAKAAEGVNTM